MLPRTIIALVGALPAIQAADTILGVYIFSRHGDRTSKSTPPATLTDLGYQQVFSSGTYYRNRYVSSNASSRINGIQPDMVRLSQLGISAPLDNVLMSSATAFTQGLYPPYDSTNSTQRLRNGTEVQSPLGGYQIVPVQQTTSGVGSEDAAWLQGSSNCANALVSSNNYFISDDYKRLQNSTMDFYKGVQLMVQNTFNSSQTTYKSAYTVYDLLNVASIHNTTFPSSDLLTNDTLFQLRTLADTHEFNLAYNASDSIRAIAGATLGAQIVQGLNQTISTNGSSKLTIQFGAYASFQSFFGLSNLTAAGSGMFYGIPDYASSMAFELYTTGAPSPFPDSADLRVRFLFANMSAGDANPLQPYPLFGGAAEDLSWADFTTGMNRFAIGDQADWCAACGNTTGVCAGPDATSGGSTGGAVGASSGAGGSGSSISNPVAGVIGAMVTLAVILGVEALAMLIFGLRLGKKRTAAGATDGGKP